MGKGGTLGSWGKVIVFKVSSKKVLTPRDFSRKTSIQFAEHSLANKRPKLQFLNAGLDEFTFTVVLDASLGIKPRKTMYNIRKAAKHGQSEWLIIGKKTVSKHKTVITDISEAYNVVYNKGEIVRATVDLSFKEYT